MEALARVEDTEALMAWEGLEAGEVVEVVEAVARGVNGCSGWWLRFAAVTGAW